MTEHNIIAISVPTQNIELWRYVDQRVKEIVPTTHALQHDICVESTYMKERGKVLATQQDSPSAWPWLFRWSWTLKLGSEYDAIIFDACLMQCSNAKIDLSSIPCIVLRQDTVHTCIIFWTELYTIRLHRLADRCAPRKEVRCFLHSTCVWGYIRHTTLYMCTIYMYMVYVHVLASTVDHEYFVLKVNFRGWWSLPYYMFVLTVFLFSWFTLTTKHY